MDITATMIKELRDRTGAGVMDCRSALTEANGDLDRAAALIQQKGASTAAKKAGRETNQGLIESYIHPGNRLGALVEVNCETDFVARTDAFRELARELAMHVAAANPRYVSLESLPEGELEEMRGRLRQEAAEEGQGKPENVIDRIVDGRIRKFAEESCLLDQKWIRDDTKTIRELIQQTVQQTSENIQVRRFARYGLGE